MRSFECLAALTPEAVEQLQNKVNGDPSTVPPELFIHLRAAKQYGVPNAQNDTLWRLYAYDRGAPNDKVLVDELAATFENTVRILGAFHWNGCQLGQTMNRDGQAEGEALIPLDPETFDFLPSVTKYDEDGNVVSIEPATDLKLMTRFAGQKERQL